jgi:hypothetical protein
MSDLDHIAAAPSLQGSGPPPSWAFSTLHWSGLRRSGPLVHHPGDFRSHRMCGCGKGWASLSTEPALVVFQRLSHTRSREFEEASRLEGQKTLARADDMDRRRIGFEPFQHDLKLSSRRSSTPVIFCQRTSRASSLG